MRAKRARPKRCSIWTTRRVPTAATRPWSSLICKAWHGATALAADVILLNCGLHDIKTDPVSGAKQVALAQYQDNLRAIIEVVVSTGASMIWVRTTPCDEAVHNRPDMAFHRFAADGIAYNEAADSIMADAGIPSIDLYNFTLGLGPDLYCDHVHFHEAIREKQGIYIAGWLTGWVLAS